MKDKYIRLKAMLLAGTFALTSTSLTGCEIESNSTESNQEIVSEMTTTHFGIGQHIISVPIENDVRYSNVQYDYHPGYEPIGIALTAVGQYGNFYAGGGILYSNVEEVECVSVDNNEKYLEFGTPLHIEQECVSSDNIKEFNVGQHIISIPIKEEQLNEDIRYNYYQYEYHEGYEVVGIALTSIGTGGAYSNCYGGGVLLYKNIVPVKCIGSVDENEETHFTEFGEPIELEKTNGDSKKLELVPSDKEEH
ncbi:MAG: hypothetical protein IKF36_04185 [Bacilli bacterium]|nr:hypothetical protein [Bacilli bacterium]